MKKETIFKGVGTALVTPLNENGIDYDAFERIINWQIEEGVNALVICGTTGEGSTLSDEEHRDALKLCGRESGRDTDKLAACGLHTVECDGVPAIKEAKTVLVCKKLYEDELREDRFLEPSVMETYRAKKDFHTFYVCEIEKIYEKI